MAIHEQPTISPRERCIVSMLLETRRLRDLSSLEQSILSVLTQHGARTSHSSSSINVSNMNEGTMHSPDINVPLLSISPPTMISSCRTSFETAPYDTPRASSALALHSAANRASCCASFVSATSSIDHEIVPSAMTPVEEMEAEALTGLEDERKAETKFSTFTENFTPPRDPKNNGSTEGIDGAHSSRKDQQSASPASTIRPRNAAKGQYESTGIAWESKLPEHRSSVPASRKWELGNWHDGQDGQDGRAGHRCHSLRIPRTEHEIKVAKVYHSLSIRSGGRRRNPFFDQDPDSPSYKVPRAASMSCVRGGPLTDIFDDHEQDTERPAKMPPLVSRSQSAQSAAASSIYSQDEEQGLTLDKPDAWPARTSSLGALLKIKEEDAREDEDEAAVFIGLDAALMQGVVNTPKERETMQPPLPPGPKTFKRHRQSFGRELAGVIDDSVRGARSLVRKTSRMLLRS